MAPDVKEALRMEASKKAHHRELFALPNAYQVSANEDTREIHNDVTTQI